MADTPPDASLTDEAGKAWVLDAIERLDEASFVWLMAIVATTTKALVITEPRPETLELGEAIETYLATRGVTLPY